MGADQSIQSFWDWFRENESALYEATGRKDGVWDAIWDEVPKQLHQIDERLWFEVSHHPDGGVREFIVTAQGNVEAFDIADTVVGAAPELSRWKMISLKPALGFDFKSNYEDLEFDPRKMWFMPLSNPNRPGYVGLDVGIPGYDSEREQSTLNAVLMILDTGLGERAAQREIQHVRVSALPQDPESLGYIELPELPGYLAWRKREIKTERGSTSS